jgi:predicted ATPase/DNA-binding CsgD family transcriptional regulator
MVEIVEAMLPESPGRLIGRASEVALAHRQLTSGDVRLLTLSGVGGIGKTRVALEVARTAQSEFSGGARFVELAPFRESALVLSAIQAAVSPGQPPGSRPPLDALKRALQRLHLLLVLDNFEQVLEAAPLIAELLAACPRLTVLATSRSPLRLRWEHELALGPLQTPPSSADRRPYELTAYPSVALLIDRLTALGLPTKSSPEELVILADICRRLDGIPLAIELAAARARVLSLADVLARLGRPLDLLTTGARDIPLRHQALRATFDWSYELLPEADRRVFRALGVFVGGSSIEAAAQVCGAEPDDICFLDALGRLVENGLVSRVTTEGAGQPRMTLLEPVREYALEQLHACGEEGLAYDRHARVYLELAETVEPHIRTVQDRVWLQQLDREHANILFALRWCIDHGSVERALRLASALCMFWWIRGFMGEALDRLTQALAMVTPEPALGSLNFARANALAAAGAMSFWKGDYAATRMYCSDALALYEEGSEPARRGFASMNLANCFLATGELNEAEKLYTRTRELCLEAADASGAARALMNLGHVAWYRGDNRRAAALLAESFGELEVAGDLLSAAYAARSLAIIECQQGNAAAAVARARQSLSICQEFGGRILLPIVLDGCAIVAIASGDTAQGLKIAAKAAILRDDLDTRASPHVTREVERWVGQANAALGADASQRAWAAGLAASVEALVAEFLDADGHVPEVEHPGATATVRDMAAAGLTKRETEVLEMVAAGNMNKEIASRLHISVATVERHLANIYAKIGARGRVEAAAFAITSGLAASRRD